MAQLTLEFLRERGISEAVIERMQEENVNICQYLKATIGGHLLWHRVGTVVFVLTVFQ